MFCDADKKVGGYKVSNRFRVKQFRCDNDTGKRKAMTHKDAF